MHSIFHGDLERDESCELKEENRDLLGEWKGEVVMREKYKMRIN